MTIGQWFSFRGRIGRKTFWLGYVLPIIVASMVANALDLALGLAPDPMADVVPADQMWVAPISGLVALVTLWPMLAGSMKRLHDRNRSGWWIGGFYLFSAAIGVFAFVMIAGVLVTLYEMRGTGAAPDVPPAAFPVLFAAAFAVFGFAMWLFIETGFLRGTPGPNRFGPDPLGGAGGPQWQPGVPPPGWPQQPPPQGWQQPQWQPQPGQQGWQAPPQGWPPPQGQGAPPTGYGAPPPGYGQPPPGYGQPPPGYGQPPPGNGQPPPGYGQPPPQGPWTAPGRGGSVPPVRRD
jgi:uncharacterized membrane protein YhaH (DUF805 family)